MSSNDHHSQPQTPAASTTPTPTPPPPLLPLPLTDTTPPSALSSLCAFWADPAAPGGGTVLLASASADSPTLRLNVRCDYPAARTHPYYTARRVGCYHTYTAVRLVQLRAGDEVPSTLWRCTRCSGELLSYTDPQPQQPPPPPLPGRDLQK